MKRLLIEIKWLLIRAKDAARFASTIPGDGITHKYRRLFWLWRYLDWFRLLVLCDLEAGRECKEWQREEGTQ
jgi:hypothetical protein